MESLGLCNGYVYATDSYTALVARVPDMGTLDLLLSKREAQELLRFVRPSLVAHDDQDVIARHYGGELHIGLAEEEDSAVFDCALYGLTLEQLQNRLELINGTGDATSGPMVYSPTLLERFSKAKRDNSDHIYWYPKMGYQYQGTSLIVAGNGFIGALAGMSLDDYPKAPNIAEFLQIGGIAA
jgi:hypothetical protein